MSARQRQGAANGRVIAHTHILIRSDLLRHMYTAMAAQMALLLGVAHFFVLHVK